MREQRKVTLGPWGWSTTSGPFIDGFILNAYRYRDRKHFKDGRSHLQSGQLDGRRVATREEADNLSILYGYCQYYVRNTSRFVQSRAARKRGYVTKDTFYWQRVEWWQERLKNS